MRDIVRSITGGDTGFVHGDGGTLLLEGGGRGSPALSPSETII